ncbi:cupredoxin family copper-binding protein [Actinoplanes sp. KI2]|uniref:cupredoxin domain-containing protein n=1 Tax=Actinoplanes sp. KI2 TaxID=2983315 RepID=UPI0021D60936|nr:cupredoxin family copper-binding protein [Actinoplanes sp. KI2]MCU7724951.1 cupredoxin family copper-binding protein [Actinoplanes sp. KI2]
MRPRINTNARRMRSGAVSLALIGSFGLVAACGGTGGNKADAGLRASPGGSLPGMPGGSGPPPSMAGMPMPSPSAATAGAAAPVAGDRVAIKNFAFAPAVLTVPVGTTVTWTNQDSDAHTVTSSGSGGPLNSKALGTNDTFSHTFTKAGTFTYLCSIHPFMTATVTVTR